MASSEEEGYYEPSSDSDEGDEEGSAFETDEVVHLRAIEATRAAAVEFMESVGVASPTARQLASRIDKPLAQEVLPDAVSDLVDRFGPGASPPNGAAVGGEVAAGALSAARQPPSARQLATDVRGRTELVIGNHPQLRSELSSATSARALAGVLQRQPALESALTAAAQELSREYEASPGLKPSKSSMASAFEILVAELKGQGASGLAAARPDLSTATSAELFFAGVLLSQMASSEDSAAAATGGSALGGSGSSASSTSSSAQLLKGLRLGPNPSGVGQPLQSPPAAGSGGDFLAGLFGAGDEQLAMALEASLGLGPTSSPGGGSGSGAGVPPPAADREDQELAQALVASMGTATTAPATQRGGGWEGAGAGHRLGSSSSSGGGGGGGGSGGGSREDDELAQALALSMAPAAVAVSESDVSQLMAFGFERARVVQALEAANGQREAAANILLGT